MIPSFSLYDTTLDPAGRINRMPINMGQGLLPHAVTYQGTISSIARVYRPSDEALKQSFENARIMRNDTAIMECVEMRQRACCLFDWHVEPENKKDSGQVQCAAELTRMLEDIPRFIQYRENLLHATFYGKYGVQQRWQWKRTANNMRIAMTQWLPVNGDKLVFRYDDGLGTYRPDQVGIRIGAAYPGWESNARKWERLREEDPDAVFKNADKLPIIHGQMKGKIQPTDYGLAYFLDTWERPLLAIHKHQIEDGEYEEPTNAGRIHGKGLRSVLYWVWFQKQEALSLLMEYLERSAFGFNVWYYPMHNPTAKEEIEKAALRQSESGGSRNIVFFPMVQDDQSALYRVEHIEPGMGGADALRGIINDYFGHQIKRYVLGQTLTSEASATGLGSNLAEVQVGTFMQIVRYDSQLLEETITTDLLQPMLQFNFPEYANVRFRFRIDTETPDAEARLNAIKIAYEMGLKIDAAAVRDLLGAPVPEAGAEVLDMAALQKSIQPPPMMGGGNGFGGNGGPEKQAMVHGIETRPLQEASYDADGPPSERSERDRLLESDAPRATVAGNGIAERLRDAFGSRRYAAGWDESEHPRDEEGKFSDGERQGREYDPLKDPLPSSHQLGITNDKILKEWGHKFGSLPRSGKSSSIPTGYNQIRELEKKGLDTTILESKVRDAIPDSEFNEYLTEMIMRDSSNATRVKSSTVRGSTVLQVVLSELTTGYSLTTGGASASFNVPDSIQDKANQVCWKLIEDSIKRKNDP